ncbi:MAG: ribonuclease P protein component [Anaerolineae bacterium]|nr:MAG: ribonuclease P protein component [Anaerolineae bacterium]
MGRPLVGIVCPTQRWRHQPYRFSVSRRLGNAVRRNRARRRLREAVRGHFASIANGWDLVFIARPPLAQADFADIEAACLTLLKRAQLLTPATV